MKWCIVLLALMQSCSGYPVYNAEVAAMANRALGASLTNVNSVYAGNLYRVSRGSVKRVVPTGLNTYDLLLKFAIKETECLKTSREDPQSCAYKAGFFVPTFDCSSQVRVSADQTQVVSLRCSRDSGSSSSESSEEMFGRRRQQPLIPTFVDRSPAPPPPPPPPPPRTPVEVQPPPVVDPIRSVQAAEAPPPNPANPAYPGGYPVPGEEVPPRGDNFGNWVE